MDQISPNEITEQLIAWSKGDTAALEKLIASVYQELRRMADNYLRGEDSGHSLQPTALVHEAYLRLIDQTKVEWHNRAHFFGVAAQMMRRILIDHAKAKHRLKRGGTAIRVMLDENANFTHERAAELIALDEALQTLAVMDQRKSRIVELRYFGGLSVEETAQVLGVSDKTVMRDWNLAKAWLYRELTHESQK
ncbi:MAG TPA: sigma-70 family RNA polymerase sigma factor [Pyrinomonadaceae bacterium]|nr:sigma-70 family RNA polymerase sigma factor [Pyrinomonadaceae bacterium]